MSYASVTASNISPESPQPRPDPSLLNTSSPEASEIADDTAKINVVAGSYRENPRTFTSEGLRYSGEGNNDSNSNSSDRGRNRHLREAKAEGEYLWETMKRFILRPEMAGGCVGLVNLGLLGGLSRVLYLKPNLRRDSAFVFSTAIATVGLLLAEGYAAKKYRQTPRGREEERRAKEEGALIYKKMREVVFRPGVFGGLIGLANSAVLGTLGYFAFTNWDRPRWDRRTVSGIAIGLFALVSGEGLLAEQYRK